MRFDHYAKLKDRICLKYTGHDAQIAQKVVQLARKYPDVTFYFCLQKEFLGGLENGFGPDQFTENKGKFAIVKEFYQNDVIA